MKLPFLPDVSQMKIISVLWNFWKYANKFSCSIFPVDMSYHKGLWESYTYYCTILYYIFIYIFLYKVSKYNPGWT